MAITPLSATIDLNPSYKVNTVVYVSQLDNNLRQIAFTIKDGGVNYDVAASGYDVYIEGTKPDNRGFSYKVTDIGGTVSGSVVTVPIQTQMTAVQGLVSTEIVLKSGANRIGSANFILMVERAGLADDIDVSETDIPGYINGAQQAAAAAMQSAEDAEQAKDTAVEAAETAQQVKDSIPQDYSDLSNDVTDLKTAFSKVTEQTRNLFNLTDLQIGKAWNGATNPARAIVNIPIVGGSAYIITFSSSVFDVITVFEKENAADTTALYSSGVSSGFTRTANASATCLCLQFNKTAVSETDFSTLDMQIEYGTSATPYIKNLSATDIELRNEAITFVTPEMYGAWGDGIHDDTVALQTALNSGKNVIANGKYKITSSLAMTPVYTIGQRFTFNHIVCTANTVTALKVNGRNAQIEGFYIEAKGTCISFGETSLTYDCDAHISILNSTAGACVLMGGGSGNVSEIAIRGERFNYYTVGVQISPVNAFVGQITFSNMTFNTDNDDAGYAFFANGSAYPMTGLTCFNVSLEGAKGGFNFINSQVSTPITPLYCFGLRTSELTAVNGYKLLRLTGNGIIAGDIYGDIITLDSIDVSQHSPDITLEQSLNIHGRIKGFDRGWRNIRVVGNLVVPTWNEEYASNVANPVYTDNNLPYTVNLISGAASWDVDFMFDGSVTFISTANGTTLAINGTTITMNNTQRVVVRTVRDQTDVHVMVLRPDGTEVPRPIASA